MAVYALTAQVVTVNSVDYSDHLTSATLTVDADQLPATTFASAGWKEVKGGLKGGTVDIEWLQDYASGGIDSVAYALVGSTAAMEVRPAGTAAAGTSSPAYQFSVLVTGWNPIDSAVGDLATVSVSWPITGAVTRATA